MENMFLPASFLGCESNFKNAEFVIFGAPFDGTTSFRPGTRFAPQTMRMESIGIETYSPYFDRDLEELKIHDSGDLDFPFGAVEQTLEMIEITVKKILEAEKKPIMIGGEHLVSLPAIKETAKKFRNLHIIHFDAHTDLREEYIGQKLSHASVIKRVWDIVGDNKIFQFGIRSGTKEEFDWAKEGHTFLNKFNFNGIENAVNQIGNEPVYLTIDLDVLDPSLMSGTGTPEAGGVTFKELMYALDIVSKLNIVASDIVELSPHYDSSGTSTATACKILREVIFTMCS